MFEESDAFLLELAKTPRIEPEQDRAGTQLGRFDIQEELGRGGMGIVYAAIDRSLGRQVAIKLVRGDDEARRQRLMREARAASAVKHPNVAAIHEVGEVDGATFIVMERIDGRSLREMLADGPLGEAECFRIGEQIARGMGAAHAAGVIHRDLKPENIMLEQDGNVKLLDFGLAKQVESAQPSGAAESLLTEDGTVLGTPHYMAPEQAEGKQVDARADVFALGVILYEMLAGERPFQGNTPMATVIAASRDDAVPIHRVATVSRARSRLVMRLLARKPDGRPHDGTEVALALYEAARQRRGWRLLVAAAAAAVMAVVLSRGVAAYSEPSPVGKRTESTRLPGNTSLRVAPQAPQPESVPSVSAATLPRPKPNKVRPTSAEPLDPLADQK